MPKRKKEDSAATTERLEQHWYGPVISGTRTCQSDPIARSGTSDITIDNDDANPVKPVKEKEVDALQKLKKDKEAMMRRIIYDGERSSTKDFTLKSGLKVVLPSKKGGKKGKKKTRKKRRRKRRQSRRKSKGRKRRRKKRTKRRK